MSADGPGSIPASSETPTTSGTQLEQNNTLTSDLFEIPPDYKLFQDKVTCHRCKDFQPGHVYVCPLTHLFCRPCYVTCKGICPFLMNTDEEQGSSVPCTSPLLPTKDEHHDAIFDASTFKCIYAKHGCNEKVTGTYYKVHMASCSFRPGPKGVPGKKSCVKAVYHVVKRVTPEYAEAQKKMANITWSPEIQKFQEEQRNPDKADTIVQNLPNTLKN